MSAGAEATSAPAFLQPNIGSIDFPCLRKLPKKFAGQRSPRFVLLVVPRTQRAARSRAPSADVSGYRPFPGTRRSKRLGQIAILIAVHFLVLQRFHERLAGGVVPGVALAGHADANAVGFQQRDVVATGVLRAAIRVMHQSRRWRTTFQRPAQRG